MPVQIHSGGCKRKRTDNRTRTGTKRENSLKSVPERPKIGEEKQNISTQGTIGMERREERDKEKTRYNKRFQ